jgi:hypothetical protein
MAPAPEERLYLGKEDEGVGEGEFCKQLLCAGRRGMDGQAIISRVPGNLCFIPLILRKTKALTITSFSFLANTSYPYSQGTL